MALPVQMSCWLLAAIRPLAGSTASRSKVGPSARVSSASSAEPISNSATSPPPRLQSLAAVAITRVLLFRKLTPVATPKVWKESISTPERASHTRVSPLRPPPASGFSPAEATRDPSGLKAVPSTGAPCTSVSSDAPLAASHRRTVPSRLAEATWSPSGLKATLCTRSLCPARMSSSLCR